MAKANWILGILLVCATGACVVLGIYVREDRAELRDIKAALQNLPRPTEPTEAQMGSISAAVSSIARMAAAQNTAPSGALRAVQPAIGEVDNEEGIEPSSSSRPRKAPSLETTQANIAQAFAKETIDPTWSRDSERHLSSILRTQLPDTSRVTSIECRSTMCEIKLEHGNVEDGEKYLVQGFSGWPGTIMVLNRTENGNTGSMVLVAGKENTVLPYDG